MFQEKEAPMDFFISIDLFQQIVVINNLQRR